MKEIIPTALNLDNYIRIFSKDRVLKPFVNSIKMTFIASALSLLITVPVSYLIVKRKNRITHLVEMCLMLPVAIPVGSIAVNLINAFNKRNIFTFNKPLIGTFIILPIAYMLLTIPMLLRNNISAMERLNDDLEYSAKSLGADMKTVFLKITVREVSPFIIGGAILSYIRTFGEYTVSAFLYGVHNKPVSIAMVNALQEYDVGLSMAYGSLTVAVCFLGAFLIEVITKKYS